jgi:hypothetical protein
MTIASRLQDKSFRKIVLASYGVMGHAPPTSPPPGAEREGPAQREGEVGAAAVAISDDTLEAGSMQESTRRAAPT